MISKQIGRFFSYLRDRAARGLLRLGVRPNAMTLLGMILTVGAGAALAAGPAYGSTWVVGLLVGAGACDLLDGALAKLGSMESRFGGVLDSACDRASDAALYLGPAWYFMTLSDAAAPGAARPNLTLVLLAFVGLVWAYGISYIRARAETAGARGGGGFWQRPERVVTILLGAAFHHVATAIWILALWPLATVAHRLWHARKTCAMVQAGQRPVEDQEPRGLLGVVLWRWPRGTVPFDIHAGTVILMLVFWDIPTTLDPLREWLARCQ